MTDQSQSGRQDGDRMRSSYLEMMRAHVDEGGRLSHRNGCDLLAEVERLRATPPSSNGAEGAGDINRCIATIENSYAFKTFAGIPLKNCGEWIYLKHLLAAPPQPAPGHTDLMVSPESIDAFMEQNPLPVPDAMRSALDTLIDVALRAEDNSDSSSKEDQDNKQAKTLERIDAAGFLYEGQISGLVIDSLHRLALIETTHDPGSHNWMLTAAGRAALSQPARSDGKARP